MKSRLECFISCFFGYDVKSSKKIRPKKIISKRQKLEKLEFRIEGKGKGNSESEGERLFSFDIFLSGFPFFEVLCFKIFEISVFEVLIFELFIVIRIKENYYESMISCTPIEFILQVGGF